MLAQTMRVDHVEAMGKLMYPDHGCVSFCCSCSCSCSCLSGLSLGRYLFRAGRKRDVCIGERN